MKLVQFFCCLLVGSLAIDHAVVPSGYSSYIWTNGLSSPRGIMRVSSGEMLVLEAGANRVTCLWDDNKDGKSDPTSERMVIASASGLNHGLNVNGNYLYASSPSTVYRWTLSSQGIRTALTNPQVVVSGIPTSGHSTRTLEFDSQGRLYVSCGSDANVDPNADRALIRRFDLSNIGTGGIAFTSGSIFAIGLRNEVGIRFDKDGGLWGVENGVDNLARAPWGDIHQNNPTEEVNYFGSSSSTGGLFYGYPYCWSSYVLPTGEQVGTQFAHPTFMNDGTHTDGWCQNQSNVVSPKFGLPAHTAPLDILFYYGTSFPGVNSGDAFVALHGSWNRDIPQGYRVVRVAFQNGVPQSFQPFFASDSTNGTSESQNWPYRPAGLAVSTCESVGECLLISSDATGSVVSVSAGISPSNNGFAAAPSLILFISAIVISML